MRRFPLILVAAISVVAGLTLAGAVARGRSRPANPPGLSTSRRVEVVAGPVGLETPFPSPGPGSPPGLEADSFRVTTVVTGRTVAVAGRCRIFDPVPGNLFVWRLRLYAGTGRQPRLLQEHDYADHAETLAPGETIIRPTFADSIELAPGRYTLELWMYVVPPGYPHVATADLERLTIATLSGEATVVVPE